jgi:two-component sensor histidine kinase
MGCTTPAPRHRCGRGRSLVLERRYRQTHHGRPRFRPLGRAEKRNRDLRRPVSAYPSGGSRQGAGGVRGDSLHCGAYEIDFRIMVGDDVRWVSARGQGDDAGIVGRIMFGIFIDVTGRKQAEEGHELLAGEMSHRVKNLLAIASGLTAITSRSTTSTVDMARELTQRLTALGRAHDLVRPIPGHEGKAALLGDLLTVLLAPYDDMGAFSGRVRVSVPRMGVGEASATTLAMVVHELATNSLKYGALSAATGTLDVSCALPDTDVVLVWTEEVVPQLRLLQTPEVSAANSSRAA